MSKDVSPSWGEIRKFEWDPEFGISCFPNQHAVFFITSVLLVVAVRFIFSNIIPAFSYW